MAVRNISEAKPKKKSIRKVHILWILCVVVLFVFVFSRISANYAKADELNNKVSEINEEITELDNESEDIKDILAQDNHDDYFEKIAREKYGYCKPGEKVYYNSSFGE